MELLRVCWSVNQDSRIFSKNIIVNQDSRFPWAKFWVQARSKNCWKSWVRAKFKMKSVLIRISIKIVHIFWKLFKSISSPGTVQYNYIQNGMIVNQDSIKIFAGKIVQLRSRQDLSTLKTSRSRMSSKSFSSAWHDQALGVGAVVQYSPRNLNGPIGRVACSSSAHCIRSSSNSRMHNRCGNTNLFSMTSWTLKYKGI